MKRTVGEINFNKSYLRLEVCNCYHEQDDYDGTFHRWCPLKCPLRDKGTEECLLDLIDERENINSNIKKFANVEIEVDEKELRKMEKIIK